MNMLRLKMRWLVIPALVLGLGAAGVSNCLQFGGGCAAAGSPVHPVKVCSCCKGHCDGRCGMACCQKPAPSQDQLPPQPKSHDDSGPTLGLSTMVPAGTDFATAGGNLHDSYFDAASAAAFPSLLALNIRFNV
jgi:hypothetical protein